jgi:hypothetical protein
VRALKAGAQVVVGTPGRILDLYKQKFLSFPWTEFVILDEADVMFEIGFIDDVKEILSLTPDERQTLLFSATFPPELLKLARANTRDPAEVATAAGVKTVDNIEQSFIRVDDEDRGLALMRLIENSEDDDVFLVFCSRRTDVDKLFRRLERMPLLDQGAARRLRPGGALPRDDRVPHGRGQGARRDRRRLARPRRGARHDGRELRLAAGHHRLHAPDRPHGPRRTQGPRDHARRRDGQPPLDADPAGSHVADPRSGTADAR